MPSAASSTRATCAFAWRPASSRRSAAPRSAASRISRTCSDVPADSDAAGPTAAAPAQPLDLVRHLAQVRVDGPCSYPRRPTGKSRRSISSRSTAVRIRHRSASTCWITACPTKWVGRASSPCRPPAAAGERRVAAQKAIRKRTTTAARSPAPSCRSRSPPPGRSPSRARCRRAARHTCRPSGAAHVDPHDAGQDQQLGARALLDELVAESDAVRSALAICPWRRRGVAAATSSGVTPHQQPAAQLRALGPVDEPQAGAGVGVADAPDVVLDDPRDDQHARLGRESPRRSRSCTAIGTFAATSARAAARWPAGRPAARRPSTPLRRALASVASSAAGSWSSAISGGPSRACPRRSRARRCRSPGRRTRRPARGRAAAPGTSRSSGACRRRTRRRCRR